VTAADEYDSLISALNKAHIPLANHAFIRQIVDGVGIDGYRANVDSSKPHVVAKRSDGGRDLGIYYGYTVGFPSEEEIVRILGPGASREPAKSPKGTWWVAHPVNAIYDGSERAKVRGREAGFCACGMQLSLTGHCDYCD
jgi:hypothetical protein